MPPVGFEPIISAGERPKTYALERAATGTGVNKYIAKKRRVTLVIYQVAYTHVGSYQIPRCYVPEGRGHSYRSYFPSFSYLYGRSCRAFDLGFTFTSVYIYTYQCELVLSAKLQLQCILVNT